MTGYSGYFMQGFASGLPNLASQISAIKLKNDQKKEAEKLKQTIIDAVNAFKNNNVDELELISPTPSGNDVGASLKSFSTPQTPSTSPNDLSYEGLTNFGGQSGIGSQGTLSNPKLIPFLATIGSVSESLAATFKDIFLAIEKGDVTRYEQGVDYIKTMAGYIKDINLAGGSANSYYGFPDLVTEDSKKWFRVADMYGKTPAKNITPNVTADVATLTGGFPQSTIEELRKQPIQQPELKDIQVKLAEVDKLTFFTEERRNAMKVNILTGSDSATAEKVNAIKAAGGTNADILESLGAGVVGVNPPKAEETRVTSLTQLEEYRDKALNADSWEEAQGYINDYTTAGYDASQLGVTKEAWINAHKQNMDRIVEMLNNITPNGKLQKDKEYTFTVDGKDTTKTGSEWYKYLYQYYTTMLDILKSNNVDISIYPAMQTFEEITKGFWGKFNEKVKKYGETLKK